MHRFLYADGDPVNHVDPAGNLATDAELLTISESVEGATAETETVVAEPTIEEFAQPSDWVRPQWQRTLIKTTAIGATVICAFNSAASWLNLGIWTGNLPPGAQVGPIIDLPCGVTAELAPSPAGPGAPAKPTRPAPQDTCGPGEHRHHMLPQNETMKAWFCS